MMRGVFILKSVLRTSFGLPEHHKPTRGIFRVAAGYQQFFQWQSLSDGVRQRAFAEELKFHLLIAQVRNFDFAFLAHGDRFFIVQSYRELLLVYFVVMLP